MAEYLKSRKTSQDQNKMYKYQIERLQGARDKLAPIIDNIVLSVVDLVQKPESKKKMRNNYVLTAEQCNDVVWASQIFEEIESNWVPPHHKKYQLPNVNVIVNNVSVEDESKLMPVKGKSIVIDEPTVMELLELYENMGVVIQRMLVEGAKPTASPERYPSRTLSFDKSTRMVSKTSRPSSLSDVEESTSQEEVAAHRTNSDVEETTSQENAHPTKTKSTLSEMLHSSSDHVEEPKKHPVHITDDDKGKSSGKIFIKIQCISDWSDSEQPMGKSCTKCAKNCPSRYHVKLDGDPVTLKVDKSHIEDGTVYCINTGGGEDESDIRIIIKQCPECRSTIIGSTSKIKDAWGESHESITLHGKQGDESEMHYSDEEIQPTEELTEGPTEEHAEELTEELTEEPTEELTEEPTEELTEEPTEEPIESETTEVDSHKCQCPSRGPICLDLSKDRCEQFKAPCRCNEPKMDVVIDTDNVEKSTIQIHDTTEVESEHEPSISSYTTAKSSIDHTKDIYIPLTRRKICSSMEFDVRTEPTRLRDKEIEHENAHIVVELQKLGVDKILRACRPAKCCRKAILNEKQKTALPYCVSLRSLPLVNKDIEVVEQSIDMSVRKIKNSLDLTQVHKDKLAFYVSLGRDDFKPNINFPWVVPLYDMKFCSDKNNDDDKVFVLKKTVMFERKMRSVSTLINHLKKKNVIQRKKWFVLRKSSFSDKYDPIKPTFRLRKTQFKKIRSLQSKFSNYFDQNYYSSILKFRQGLGSYKRKDIWGNISCDDWRLIFTEQHKQLNFNCVDIRYGKARTLKKSCKNSSKLSRPEILSRKENMKLMCNVSTEGKFVLESGDCFKNVIESYLEPAVLTNKNEVYKSKLSTECDKNKRLKALKSLPALGKNIKEIDKLARRTCSFRKMKDRKLIPKIHQIEDQCKYPLKKKVQFGRKPKKKPKKNLEYYVGLVDGDLVWSQALPLKPLNYETYYNYSNKKKNNPGDGPVEETMQVTRVTPEEARRIPTNRTLEDVRRASGLNEEYLLSQYAQSHQAPPKAGSITHLKLPPEYESFPLEPESENAPWAPYTVSDISLPRSKVAMEEVTQKQEMKKVEAVPVPPQEEAAEPVHKKTKSKCSSKAICVRNECKKCGGIKTCEPVSSKGQKHGEIRIAIKKTKDKGILCQGRGKSPCNKEICELYKNRKIAGDKPTSSRKDGKDQCFTLNSKDNIEILINSKRICLQNKTTSTTKQSKNTQKSGD